VSFISPHTFILYLANTCTQSSCLSAYSSSSSCLVSDTGCLCRVEAASSSSSFACCLTSSCTASDKASALLYVKSICVLYGVTLTASDAVCPSTIKSTTSTTIGVATSTATTATTATSQNGVGTTNTNPLLPTGTTSTSSPAADSQSTSSPSSGGLSTGAAAGIGVGATIIVLGIAIAAFLLLRRRKKAKAGVESSNMAAPLSGTGAAGLAGRAAEKAELGSDAAVAAGLAEHKEPHVVDHGFADGHNVEQAQWTTPPPPQQQQQQQYFPAQPPQPQWTQTPSPAPTYQTQELSGAEMTELESRRRAAELEGRNIRPGRGYELHGDDTMSPRAELEALRNVARFEMG
jgi:hypothetical protein